MRQCQATTLASSYSQSHRCLKTAGLKKIGYLHLCVAHQRMARAVSARSRAA